MKTNLLKRSNILTATLALATVSIHPVQSAEPAYTAHEWGTFTSVQGSDGVQLDWQAQQISELPGFVYNWSRAGLDRLSVNDATLTKRIIIARQRMETPVIYFYSDQELAVDVSVRFPQGTITEWYPQAHQIGPTLQPNATGGPTNPYGAADSRINWSAVKILPAKANGELSRLLPSDKSGSHYFAARDTDAAVLRSSPITETNSPELEKFLFYRGLGNFTAPLQVSARSDDTLTLTNAGSERLAGLFVLSVRDGRGRFLQLNELAPAGTRDVQLGSGTKPMPMAELKAQLGRALAGALVGEGLFPREAEAMVNTWKDSWFTEEGVRVLYVLPRAWTDTVLPLSLTPPPRELVRVMVGRAEMIYPSLEQSLRTEITRAAQGDRNAAARASTELRKLGRFAQPAWQLATKRINETAAAILQEAQRSRTPAPASITGIN